MLDCASFYENETIVGEGIVMNLMNGLPRDDLFVTSKVWPGQVENIEEACLDTLDALGLKQLDLYLVHWPVAMKKIVMGDGKTEGYE